jgi:predicted Zn-ribbon and HTH transcriptional regulator
MSVNSCNLNSTDRLSAAFLFQQISADRDHEDLSCPISSSPYQAPVITPCGHTFEGAPIRLELNRRNVCPLDRRPLTDGDLIPNYFVKRMSEVAQEIIKNNLRVVFLRAAGDHFEPRCPINHKPLFEAVRLPCGHQFNRPAIDDRHFCPIDNIFFDQSDLCVDMDIQHHVNNTYPRYLQSVQNFNDALNAKMTQLRLDDRHDLIHKISNIIKCPLSKSIMKDPHIAECGHTFDKDSIHAKSICPYDHSKITKVFSNRLAKDILEKLHHSLFSLDDEFDHVGVFLVLNSHNSIFKVENIAIKLGIFNPTIEKPTIDGDSLFETEPLSQMESLKAIDGKKIAGDKIKIVHPYSDFYFDLVQEILTQQWDQHCQNELPLPIKSVDLTAGMKLLIKIALKAINQQNSLEESIVNNINGQVSLDEFSTQITVKIKGFIEDKADAFKKVCKTGFPFSLLEASATEASLMTFLKNSTTEKYSFQRWGSVLSHFMKLEESIWMNEEDLNRCFTTNTLRCFQIREIAATCSNLKQAYLKNGDDKAGYYLLCLIKQTAGCVYDIPRKDSFNDSTAAKVLSLYFIDDGLVADTQRFLEILYHRNSRSDAFLYQELLDSESRSILLDFTVEHLQNIPRQGQWPNKGRVITDLLEIITPKKRVKLAEILSSNTDPFTSQVGSHLLASLTAFSHVKALTHLYSLIELLPHLNHTHVEKIFGRRFILFCLNNQVYRDYPYYGSPIHLSMFNHPMDFKVDQLGKIWLNRSLMINQYGARPRGEVPLDYADRTFHFY